MFHFNRSNIIIQHSVVVENNVGRYVFKKKIKFLKFNCYTYCTLMIFNCDNFHNFVFNIFIGTYLVIIKTKIKLKKLEIIKTTLHLHLLSLPNTYKT